MVNIPGFLAMFIALYFGLRYFKDNITYKWSWIGFIIFTLFSYLLKNNYLISTIAFMIICILNALKTKKWHYILIVISLVIGIGLLNNVIFKTYSNITKNKVPSGIPKTAWIAMGMQGSLKKDENAGWYNAYTTTIYDCTGQNTSKTNTIALNYIKRRLTFFEKNPLYAYRFEKKKLLSTWADPMFESIFSGPNQQEYTVVSNDPTFKNCYCHLYYYVTLMMHVLILCIVFETLIWTFRNVGKISNNYQLFILLFLIGGFIFQLIWETKSQYVFQYIYCLIPLAALEFDNLKIRKNNKKEC